MAKRKLKSKEERNLYYANVSIRFSDEEATRWYQLFDSAELKFPRVGNTDILRELLELDEPHVLTKEDIHYFRTGEKEYQLMDAQEGEPVNEPKSDKNKNRSVAIKRN